MKTYIHTKQNPGKKEYQWKCLWQAAEVVGVYCCYCLSHCCLYYSYKFFKIIHNENHLQRIWLGSSPCEMALDHWECLSNRKTLLRKIVSDTTCWSLEISTSLSSFLPLSSFLLFLFNTTLLFRLNNLTIRERTDLKPGSWNLEKKSGWCAYMCAWAHESVCVRVFVCPAIPLSTSAREVENLEKQDRD